MGCSASVASRSSEPQATQPNARPIDLERISQPDKSRTPSATGASPSQTPSRQLAPTSRTPSTSGAPPSPRKPSQSGSALAPSPRSNSNLLSTADRPSSHRSSVDEASGRCSRPSSAASAASAAAAASATGHRSAGAAASPRQRSAPRNLSSEDEDDDEGDDRRGRGHDRRGSAAGVAGSGGSRPCSVPGGGGVGGSGGGGGSMRPSSADGGVTAAASASVALSDSTRSSVQAPLPSVKISSKVVRDDSPLATVTKGITLRALRVLRNHIRDAFGDDFYASLSTSEVNTAFVQRVTSPANCRLAELPDLIPPSELGPPDYFVSHAWANNFDGLLAAVEAFLEGASETTRVWIDIVAVNQHAGPHQKADVAAFKDVVRAASGGTLAVMGGGGGGACSPAGRAWCLYEWAATLATHGSDGLHLHHLTSAERTALVCGGLDMGRAECSSPDDKAAILADVVRQYGSVAALNDRLRLWLTLQPLS